METWKASSRMTIRLNSQCTDDAQQLDELTDKEKKMTLKEVECGLVICGC